MRDERRQDQRVEWIDSGLIDQGKGLQARPCVVRNLSNGGAKLIGVDAATVPDEFTLHLTVERGSARKCHVVWRGKNELGIEFDEPFAASTNGPKARNSARQTSEPFSGEPAVFLVSES